MWEGVSAASVIFDGGAAAPAPRPRRGTRAARARRSAARSRCGRRRGSERGRPVAARNARSTALTPPTRATEGGCRRVRLVLRSINASPPTRAASRVPRLRAGTSTRRGPSPASSNAARSAAQRVTPPASARAAKRAPPRASPRGHCERASIPTPEAPPSRPAEESSSSSVGVVGAFDSDGAASPIDARVARAAAPDACSFLVVVRLTTSPSRAALGPYPPRGVEGRSTSA